MDRWTVRGGGGAAEREGIPGIEYSLGRGLGVGWDWGQGQLSTLSFPTAKLCFRCTVAVGYASHNAVSGIPGLLAPQRQPSECMGSTCDNSDGSTLRSTNPVPAAGGSCMHKLGHEDPARPPLTG